MGSGDEVSETGVLGTLVGLGEDILDGDIFV